MSIIGITNETKDSIHDGHDPGKEGAPGEAAAAGRAEDRLLTANFVLSALANFFNAFSQQTLTATLPVYVLSLGGSQAEAGLVTGALAITSLLCRPLLGWLIDAWRRRPLILIGTSLYCIASMIYLVVGSIPFLVFGRLVHGLGLSSYSTASHAYVADIAPLKRRAEAVGLFAATHAAGLIIGPVIGFMLVGWSGFHHLFYFTGGLVLISFILSIFPQERRQTCYIERQPWSLRTGLVAVDALPVTWMATCMGAGYGAINAFISIFAQSRGIENPGFYFMVQAIALLVSRTFAGRLADRYGRYVVIIPGIIFMAVASGILPFAYGFPSFAISASLFGMGFGSAQPATMALLIDRVRPEQRGLATGTYFTGFDLGFLVGTILMGVVSQHRGYGTMWSIAAACIMLSLAGILADRRRERSKRGRL
jgi:MFS family permease